MDKFKRVIAIVMMICMTSTISFAGEVKESNIDVQTANIEAVMKVILGTYVGGDITEEELAEAAIKGMFDKLDDYSIYYNKEEFNAFNESVSGNFVGIGARINSKEGRVFIVQPLEDSPAKRADLHPGDEILKVDGEEIEGMTFETVLSKIKGEKDTEVVLTLKRADDIIEKKIIRDEIKINPIEVKDIKKLLPNTEYNDEIKYMVISDFNSNVYNSFRNIVNGSKEDGTKGLIIDLRNNPGGYLDQVIKMCKLVIPEGPIVHTIDKKGNKRTYNSRLDEEKFEIIVIINENSASASEIFAGAVKDSKAGTLLGEKTFGKGVVQKILKDAQGNYFKLTMEEYLTRNENHINKVGIEPDVLVEIPDYVTDIEKKYNTGDEDDRIEKIEKILSYLGYEIKNIDKVYAEETHAQIMKFQADTELHPYGVADLTTQKMLNTMLLKKIKEDDIQLREAYELMKNKLIQNN